MIIGIVVDSVSRMIVMWEGRVGIHTLGLEWVWMASAIQPIPQGIGRKRCYRRMSGCRRGGDWTVLRTNGRLGIARWGVVRGQRVVVWMAGMGVSGWRTRGGVEHGRHGVGRGWVVARTRAGTGTGTEERSELEGGVSMLGSGTSESRLRPCFLVWGVGWVRSWQHSAALAETAERLVLREILTWL